MKDLVPFVKRVSQASVSNCRDCRFARQDVSLGTDNCCVRLSRRFALSARRRN
jgi:hypothetical protein